MVKRYFFLVFVTAWLGFPRLHASQEDYKEICKRLIAELHQSIAARPSSQVVSYWDTHKDLFDIERSRRAREVFDAAVLAGGKMKKGESLKIYEPAALLAAHTIEDVLQREIFYEETILQGVQRIRDDLKSRRRTKAEVSDELESLRILQSVVIQQGRQNILALPQLPRTPSLLIELIERVDELKRQIDDLIYWSVIYPASEEWDALLSTAKQDKREKRSAPSSVAQSPLPIEIFLNIHFSVAQAELTHSPDTLSTNLSEIPALLNRKNSKWDENSLIGIGKSFNQFYQWLYSDFFQMIKTAPQVESLLNSEANFILVQLIREQKKSARSDRSEVIKTLASFLAVPDEKPDRDLRFLNSFYKYARKKWGGLDEIFRLKYNDSAPALGLSDEVPHEEVRQAQIFVKHLRIYTQLQADAGDQECLELIQANKR